MKYDESEVFKLLREAHAEPIDTAHYTSVRSRVLAEIERTRSPWRRLAWVSGVLSFAAAVVLLIALQIPDVAPPPRIAATIPKPPAAPVMVARATLPHRAIRPLIPRRESFTVKLQTEDPNIVIYWIAN